MLREIVEAPTRRKRKSGVRLGLEDIKAGRVHKADSVEDLMRQLMED
ncbi:MAG: hypothetical protein HUK00_01010 [Bacteroidaceae bacterium]|nr:hypothetical protein [Bacteroidaceae bacterium]